MSSIDEIKARIDIVDLVSEDVQLRKSGRNYTGFCPFHSNTRTPAFVVFQDSGTWRCFGQCNEGGDIFSYVMKREGWDFVETLKYLAEKAGIELKPVTPQQQEAVEENDRLRGLLEEAVTFYHHHLRNTPAGKPILDYLHQKRGLNDATIEAFGLGYAPPGWDNALKHFTAKGYTEQDLLDTGLLTERQPDPANAQHVSRSTYDRFRHRIMIPIRDERGRMSGFGARIVNPDDVPKFLNSPQTELFDKGRLLYGLDCARKAIRAAEQAVIVEGYFDVIALHQAGFENAVSPMGTALNEHQFQLLNRLSKRIVLALDPDAAGDKATLRGLQIARQTLERGSDPVFDARGLLGFEARLQADIRVTTLPEGLDPDEVANRDPAEWRRILDEAKPIVVHVMEMLAAGQNLDDPKTKNEIAAQVLPLIEDVPSPIERDTYRQRLARLLKVDERTLLAATPARPSRLRPRSPGTATATRLPTGAHPPQAEAPSPAGGINLIETHCLGVLLRRPDLIYNADRAMQEAGLPRLGSDDFSRADRQAIFHLVRESLTQIDAEPLEFVLNRLPAELADAADKILARTEKLDPKDERVLEDLLRALLELRRRNLRQSIDYLRYLMEESQQQGDLRATEYGQIMLRNLKTLDSLDRTIGRYTNRTGN
ncbi:MAG: DNA primase [Chloroflexota bacterium]